MTIRIDPGTAVAIAGAHVGAADGIDDLAESMPGAVAGGEGAADLTEILAVVAEAAGMFAGINRATAEMVTSAVQDLEVTDEDVAVTFDRLASVVR